jgi:hypothetical protein
VAAADEEGRVEPAGEARVGRGVIARLALPACLVFGRGRRRGRHAGIHGPMAVRIGEMEDRRRNRIWFVLFCWAGLGWASSTLSILRICTYFESTCLWLAGADTKSMIN